MEQRNLAAKIKLPFLSREYSVSNCNFMKRYKVTESEKYRPKRHFHKFYEIHIVEDGTLTYEIDGENFNLNKNDILEKLTPLIENTAMRYNLIPLEIDFSKESGKWFLRIFLYK